jgi:hypothetical protein
VPETVLVCSFAPAWLICPFHASFPFWDREITRKINSSYFGVKKNPKKSAQSIPQLVKYVKILL